MNKHTPGPWTIVEDKCEQPNLYGPESEWIAIFPHQCVESLRVQANIDARLCATAPELLEVLCNAVRRRGFSLESLAKAQTAIARARGEA